MNEEAFRKFLKQGGRTPHTVDNIVKIVRRYEAYLQKFAEGKGIDEARHEDVEAYVEWFENEEETSAKGQLWGIRYYYRFTGNRALARRVAELREERTAKTRKSFFLRDFRGVDSKSVAQLEAAGIRDVKQMLESGATPAKRTALANKTGLPEETILELVKLSDLARLPGVKAIRARLYYDAGIDTLEKMAKWDPEAMRLMLVEFVEKTGFDGIAPLPKEAANSVKVARELPKLIEF
ncbi:MAG: DUF4332 domain-containing protein [Promethearchaeota archaeon]